MAAGQTRIKCGVKKIFLEDVLCKKRSYVTIKILDWSIWIIIWLVVWNIFLFVHILGIIIPTDFHIFQRSSSTTNQLSQLLQD